MALLVVIRSIEAFEVPALVGLPGNVKVLTTDIFLDMERNVPPDFGYSSAFSVVLLALAAMLIAFYARLSRHAARYHTVTGRAFRPRELDLGRLRLVGGAVVLGNFLIVLVVPTLGLLWLSLMPFSQTVSRDGLALVTLANYATVLRTGSYLPQVWQTLVIAAGSATGAMVLMVAAGWLVVRRRRGAFMLDQLATVPLVFPGIVLGVAMMQIFLAAPVADLRHSVGFRHHLHHPLPALRDALCVLGNPANSHRARGIRGRRGSAHGHGAAARRRAACRTLHCWRAGSSSFSPRRAICRLP